MESDLKFWAKTTDKEVSGIDVFQHSINVGTVAGYLADLYKNILASWNLSTNSIAILAAMHDIGKISPGFQQKCPAWLKENRLEECARNGGWNNLEKNHAKVSQYSIQDFLKSEMNFSRTSAAYLAAALGAHHGRLSWAGERGIEVYPDEQFSGIPWEIKRSDTIKELIKKFGNTNPFTVNNDSPELWWIAGLTTIADWIGSDERFFPADQAIDSELIKDRIHSAIKELGLGPLSVRLNLKFKQQFKEGFEPNDLQCKALEAITGPGVYVIEAPMGMGKTEAALSVAYKLMESGKATGLYFALPTQATSNRIHERVADFAEKICIDKVGVRLIHGNSWLIENIEPLKPVSSAPFLDKNESDARIGRRWFASPKRAILAAMGVGTIDQALLGVVAAKHFFIRHFALAGKVIIIDEVHSYDLYTGTLIEKLIGILEKLSCTVIILSATLTEERRRKLLRQTNDEKKVKEKYPLISGRTIDGKYIHPAEPSRPIDKPVKVKFIIRKKAVEKAFDFARKGASVLWVCDTVDSAQKTYLEIKAHKEKDPFLLGLLHARFPFYRREELENEWMERLDKKGEHRCGCVLVSTQIVEQSVDLDADLMVSELAPTDMLLQRMGRLWRHERGNRPLPKLPEFWIIQEDNTLAEYSVMDAASIMKSLGSKAWVYEPYILLKTLHEWHKQKRKMLMIPSDIRDILEETYKEIKNEPLAWQKLGDKEFVKERNQAFFAAMATNFWQPALPDEEGFQTRLNERPTVSLILALNEDSKGIELLDGTSAQFVDDRFHLPSAKNLHRNLVKIPAWIFLENGLEYHEKISRYVYGMQTIGFVQDSGKITLKNLKPEISLQWDNILGVQIINSETKEVHDECRF
ncbi:MAG TPA: hypothetical protein DCO75_06930 [Fibrobacteres bacterium]|jgi:CRISPR-associated endonuclease/helicase Cas3|nr:hypothetical protein [Fibrobacterota bacterium]